MSSVVPDGWSNSPLQDICFFQEGPGLRNWQYRDSGTKFINIRCIQGGDINTSVAQHLSDEEVKEKYSHFLLNEGDYVLSSSGTIGRLALVKKHHLPLLLNTSVIRFRSIDETRLDGLFLRHFLQSKQFFDKISEQSQGSAQVNFGPTHLKVLDALLPPLPEQKKIASILTSVDEVIENTQKQIDKLQDLKKATMNELLTKGIGHTDFKDSELGRIPKSWDVKPLNDICDLQVGYAFKSTWFTQSGIALLRGENVGYGDAKWDASRYLDNDRANEFSQYRLTEGDIVIGMDRTFTKSGSKITRISSKDLPCLLVQRVGRFRSENLGSDFLWQLLRSEPYLNQLAANEKGMDIPHLSKQEILEPIVPSIPKGEQIQISSILKSFDEQSQILLTRRTQTQSLKKSLMQDLLTGKVRVTVN